MGVAYSKLDFAAAAFKGVNITAAPDQLRPGEFVATEVPVGGGGSVNWAAKIEPSDDAADRGVE